MKQLIVNVLVVMATLGAVAGDGTSPREKADRLLKTWCDGLIAVQVREFERPELKGGMLCPACGLLHGRIGDVAYPFVHLYATTGDRKYLTAAEAAVDWCEANMLFPDGLYRNDRQTEWRSTTAFFAIPLYKALRDYGDRLPAVTRDKWRAIFRRASESLYNLYEGGFSPVINYLCVYPEAMFLAWKETCDAKYLKAAERVAAEVRAEGFNAEGFLIGEGYAPLKRFETSPRGCNLIDLGYNLEESLTALIEYADMSGDAALREKAVASARLQLAFVLPDGAIDNSCGSRSVKWTYYGSRTSDGILSLLALLKDDVPYAAKMADRVIDLYGCCTGPDGLLYGGLMYADAGEPACVHHAFARAKTLVEYVRGGLAAADATLGELPREAARGCRHYRSIDADLVAVGSWRATVTANDAFNIRRGAAVSGGAMSLLWHEGLGPVFVGTLGAYFYAEAHNMQDDRHDRKMHCLTPRILAGKASNIFDYACEMKGGMKGDVFVSNMRGRLTDENGRAGAPYAISYSLSSGELTLRIETSAPGARFVLPLVAAKSDVVSVDGSTATVRRGNRTVRVKASAPVSLENGDRGDRIWSPVTGLLCAPLSVPLDKPVTLVLTCEGVVVPLGL